MEYNFLRFRLFYFQSITANITKIDLIKIISKAFSFHLVEGGGDERLFLLRSVEKAMVRSVT